MIEAAIPTFISAGATLVAALIGVGAIVWQIGRQGDLNRKSIGDAESRRLKSRMYEEVEVACAAGSDAAAAFPSGLLGATQQIQMAAYAHRDGENVPIPRARIMELSGLKSELGLATIGLIDLIERRQFIDPRVLIFRSALQSALHDIQKKYDTQFFRAGMIGLPVDLPDGSGTYPYGPLTPDLADSLQKLSFGIVEHVHDVTMYAADFSVEAQNLLVADLFGSRVEHRKPIDPRRRVITLDAYEELERHFLEHTDWGRWVRENEANAAQMIGK